MTKVAPTSEPGSAAKLRVCDEHTLPRMQELRDRGDDWLSKREMTFDRACSSEYVGTYLGVSHRWETVDEEAVREAREACERANRRIRNAADKADCDAAAAAARAAAE